MDTNLRDNGTPSEEFLAMVKRAKASAQKKLAQSKKTVDDNNFHFPSNNRESLPQTEIPDPPSSSH